MEMRQFRFYSAALAVLLLDAVTKLLVRLFLPVGASFRLLPFVSISHSENTGIAFGLLQLGFLRWPFVIIALVVSLWIIISVHGKKLKSCLLALGLVLGGALANGLERLFFSIVTDFIDFHWWPAFNVADSALTIGILLLLLDELAPAGKKSQ